MRVRIGGRIFDPNEVPIAIHLDESDRQQIANMVGNNSVYCAFPADLDRDEIIEWVDEFKKAVEEGTV